MAQTSQQTIKLLHKNWKSFFVSIKDWSKNKDKYNGKPNLPKYKHKTKSLRYFAATSLGMIALDDSFDDLKTARFKPFDLRRFDFKSIYHSKCNN